MTFTLLRKLQEPRKSFGKNLVCPSPILKSYCFVSESVLKVVDLKTDHIVGVINDVHDCIWREDNEGVEELAIISLDSKVSLLQIDGDNSIVRKALHWNSTQKLDAAEWVFCSGDKFVILVNRSRLVCTALIEDELETTWQVDLGVAAIQLRIVDSEVYFLTSQGNIIGYSLNDGSRTPSWEMQNPLPFDTSRLTDFCLCPKLRALAVCVDHEKLYSAVARAASQSSMAPCTSSVITAFVKRTPAKPAESPELWKLLLDLSSEGVSDHVMWLGSDRRIVFCSGVSGLQKVAVLELRDDGTFSALPSEDSPPGMGSFVVMHDPRASLRNAPAFLFASSTATLAFGAASRRLLAEVMEQAGTRTAETLSHLNQWQAMAVGTSVLLRGVKNRQLDMVSFFLKAKEEALEAELTSDVMPDKREQHYQVLVGESESWDSILTELGLVIRESGEELSSKHFSQQLLQLVISTVAHLLLMVCPREETDTWMERVLFKKEMSEMLCSHLIDLRSQVHRPPDPEPIPEPEQHSTSTRSDAEWDKLTEKEIMVWCVHHGNIPEGQCHILRRRETEVQLLEAFQEVAVEECLKLLRKDQFAQAEQLLFNVGIDSRPKMRELLLFCRDRAVRQVLRRELAAVGFLSSEDENLLEELDAIEACLCQANLQVASLSAKRKRSSARPLQPLASRLAMAKLEPLDISKASVKWSGQRSHDIAAGYCRLAPAWLEYWDTDTVERVLAEGYFTSGSLDAAQHSLVLDSWQLMLEHGQLELIMGGPLPREALRLNGDCMVHVQRLLSAALFRDGQVDEDTLEDFQELLGLMGRAGLRPSQLARASHGPITPEDFVHRMVHYGLQHRLYHLLYLFLKDLGQELPPLCPRCNNSFVLALREHWRWLEKPQDVSTAQRAILALAHALPQKSLLILGASKVILEDPQDISLYQLLQKGMPFNTDGLFAWQTTNACQVDSSGAVMPHFSLPCLRDKFGLKEELGYSYYLHKGRPCAAAFKLLAQELLLRGCLSEKRIRVACRRALRIAEQRPENTRVVAASIAFAELLGMNSRAFRLALGLARLAIASSGFQGKLGDLLGNLRRNKEAAREVFIQATLSVEQELVGSSFSALDDACSSKMFLLLRFASEWQLEVPDVILRICAASGDWLGFLTWAQLLQYPRMQVLELVGIFKDACLREHLSKALSVVSDLRPSEHRRRDLRASLYARIGLPAPADKAQDTPEYGGEQDALSVCSIASGDGSSMVPTDAHYSTELIELILQCHGGTAGSGMAWTHLLRAAVALNHQTPCILAGCCPNAPMASCLTLWLQLGTGMHNGRKDGQIEFTLPELRRTMEDVVAAGRLRTLLLGLQLFQPESVLVTLFEFLVAFFPERNQEQAMKTLKTLKRRFDKLEESAIPGSGLSSKNWLRETTRYLLSRSFSLCRSYQDVEMLFSHCTWLHGAELRPALGSLLASLGPSLVAAFPWHSLWEATGEHDIALAGLVAELNVTGRFTEALELARAAQLPLADVALQQLELKFEKQGGSTTEAFWDDCDRVLLQNGVDPTLAFDFLKDKTGKVQTPEEQYQAASCALRWLRLSPAWPSPETQRWEARVWKWCVRGAGRPPLEEDPGLDPLLIQPPPSPGVCSTLKDPQEVKSLKDLINGLLTQGQFCKACQLAALFACSTTSLEILLTCVRLAQGTLSVNDVDERVLELARQSSTSVGKRTSLVGPQLKLSPDSNSTSSNQDTLKLLEQLTCVAEESEELCQRVLIIFRLSMSIGCSYEELALRKDPVELLTRLLTGRTRKGPEVPLISRADFSLAKRLIMAFKVPDEKVASFLFRQAIDAIREGKSDCGILESWELALGLCHDPSLLGNLLLRARSHNLRSLGNNLKALTVEVELCIRSHSCFLEACSMEGISRVLHRCNRLTPCLVAGQHFSLLVSMLTGMARYSEMAYIFDILQQNHHLELLFQEGMEKVPYLKVALLDYLKHKGSSDPDLYSMLTLNFNMHREIAENLESVAMTKIKRLANDGPMAWNPREQQLLETVLQDLADAAESYVKAECLRKAQYCARQAQLVALQLRYFPTRLMLVNLEPSAALSAVAQHHNFFEAQILADAYGLQNWQGAALFQRVLQREDWAYFADFCSVCELTSQHAQELALKYEADTAANSKCRHALEKVLERLPCLQVRLRLAKRLGFSRLLSQTLEAHPYLKDLLTQRSQ